MQNKEKSADWCAICKRIVHVGGQHDAAAHLSIAEPKLQEKQNTQEK